MTPGPRARKLSVAVVQGGSSFEAEVSRTSAKAVATALQEAGHHVARLELDPYLAESVRGGGYEVVFPAVHGAVGEDGALQGLLEVLEVPYVGSGVTASALAFDKAQARRVFREAGLPVAPGFVLRRPELSLQARAADEGAARAREGAELAGRVVVKPARGGSAIGVSRFEAPGSASEIAAAILATWQLDDGAVVERFARGREVTCGVRDFEGTPAEAFPPTEVHAPNDAFYTYEARYAPGRSHHLCPAPLGPLLTAEVQRLALAAHRALGCRDLSRADFIVGEDADGGAVTLLEVNTLPGFTGTSLYPEAAAVAGLSFAALCDALVQSAVRRGISPRREARPFPKGPIGS